MSMTSCTKPVTRRSAVLIRDGSKPRELVVTLHAEYITLRLLGTRREETYGLEALYHAAVKGRVFRQRMEKAKDKKQKREWRKPR